MTQVYDDFIVHHVRKHILYQAGRPDRFTVSRIFLPESDDTYYAVRCDTCHDNWQRIICTWSKDYDLDGFVDFVIEFVGKHHHKGSNESPGLFPMKGFDAQGYPIKEEPKEEKIHVPQVTRKFR